MSTDPTGSSLPDPDPDLRQLRDTLARLAFPARQDDVLVELVSHHAPSRLVQRVGTLPRARQYGSVGARSPDVTQKTGLPPVTPSTVPET